MNRRRFVAALSAAGVGATLMPGALMAVAQDADVVTVEMLKKAQRLAGVEFTGEELRRVAEHLNRPNSGPDTAVLRAANLGNSELSALIIGHSHGY